MANKRFTQITRVATSFHSGDVIPLGNASLGDGQMPQGDLLRETAQNAISDNLVPSFDPTKPNDAGGYAYYVGEIVAYQGATYKFKVNHSSGVWNAAEVCRVVAGKCLKFFDASSDPEYIYAVTDKYGVFLFGIKNDGSVEWAVGVPQPIKDWVNTIIEIALLGKVDKQNGKSLINSVFASGIKVIDNDEFVYAVTDSDDKFLFGVRADGSFEWQNGVPQILENILKLKVDKVDGKSLADSMFASSLGSIDSNEFLYVLKDSSDNIIAAVKKDGGIFTGKPIEGLELKQNKEFGKTVIDEVIASASSHTKNSEFAYALLDSNNFLLFGIKHDGSFESPGLIKMLNGGGSGSLATTEYVDEKIDDEKGRAESAEAALQQAIQNIEPVVVVGGENTPDGIFLTTNENDAITLKDNDAYTFGLGVYNVKPSDNPSLVFTKTMTIYNIRFPLNLSGATINLPQDAVLNFCGGYVYNGTLVGNHTKAHFTKNCVGPSLIFTGSWDVPYICSDILADSQSANALKTLNGLLSDTTYNVLHIVFGNYIFNPEVNADKLIDLKSNTKLIIDGTLTTTPNGFPNYYLVRSVNSTNLEITGKGKIVGDADEHDYTTTPSTHEWGMCIMLSGCENVFVHDITLEDATGDGIDIAESSSRVPKQICVERCTISHCGRQGISVTAGEQIKIRGCRIDDIYRTLPRAAVDIEANQGYRVSAVEVSDLIISRCRGLMAIHSDCVEFSRVNATDCQTLFYCTDANFVKLSNAVSQSSVESSDFVIAENTCSHIFLNEVYFENDENFVVDLSNIHINYLCDFGTAEIVGSPTISSTKYVNGKYIQFNGMNWVNFDGSSIT